VGEVSPLTLTTTFLLLRGELESESHPLCNPASCPRSRHAGKASPVTATALAPRAPPPRLGTGLAAAATKGDGRAHTPSRLLCSYPAGAKESSVTSLSRAACRTLDGRGAHLCAVPLAEDEGFLTWSTWDAAGEERRQHTPCQLAVPKVSSQRRAWHKESPSAVSSWHNQPKLFPSWLSQDDK